MSSEKSIPDLNDIIELLYSSGIIYNPEDNLQVRFVPTGMNIEIFLDGYKYKIVCKGVVITDWEHPGELTPK